MFLDLTLWKFLFKKKGGGGAKMCKTYHQSCANGNETWVDDLANTTPSFGYTRHLM